MRNYFTKRILQVLFVVFGLSTSLLATDGYFSLGYGAIMKSLGGTGVAYYYTAIINGNPAGLSMLGNSYEVNLALFSPDRQYKVTGAPSGLPGRFGLTPGTVVSDKKLFLIPNFGANWMLGENSALGISVYGNGGMNTTYPTATFYDQSSTTTGVDLAQLFSNISFSHKFGANHSIGVSAVLAYQYFEANGLAAFGGFSMDGTKLSGNGKSSSTGIGFKIGYMGNLTDALHLGLVYQSRVSMSPFEEYAGLFAEGGDFDIPSYWQAGLKYDLSDKFAVLFDVKQIMYSQVNSIANPMNLRENSPALPDDSPNPNFQPLGSVAGWGFGWQDMLSLKFGLEYMASESFTFRAGFSAGEQPIPTTEVLFNILAPGVINNHLALGFSKKMGDNSLNFSFNYAFRNAVTGMNPLEFDMTGALTQEIEISMSQFDVALGFTF